MEEEHKERSDGSEWRKETATAATTQTGKYTHEYMRGEKETQTNDIFKYCMHVQEYECLPVCITML